MSEEFPYKVFTVAKLNEHDKKVRADAIDELLTRIVESEICQDNITGEGWEAIEDLAEQIKEQKYERNKKG